MYLFNSFLHPLGRVVLHFRFVFVISILQSAIILVVIHMFSYTSKKKNCLQFILFAILDLRQLSRLPI